MKGAQNSVCCLLWQSPLVFARDVAKNHGVSLRSRADDMTFVSLEVLGYRQSQSIFQLVIKTLVKTRNCCGRIYKHSVYPRLRLIHVHFLTQIFCSSNRCCRVSMHRLIQYSQIWHKTKYLTQRLSSQMIFLFGFGFCGFEWYETTNRSQRDSQIERGPVKCLYMQRRGRRS